MGMLFLVDLVGLLEADRFGEWVMFVLEWLNSTCIVAKSPRSWLGLLQEVVELECWSGVNTDLLGLHERPAAPGRLHTWACPPIRITCQRGRWKCLGAWFQGPAARRKDGRSRCHLSLFARPQTRENEPPDPPVKNQRILPGTNRASFCFLGFAGLDGGSRKVKKSYCIYEMTRQIYFGVLFVLGIG